MDLVVFTTGGSIDKTYDTGQSDFIVGEPAVEQVFREAGVTLDYRMVPVCRKDSLDMTDEDRNRLREQIARASEARILITHGTDTMIETARHLEGLEGKIIVVTGAMQPAAFKATDAVFNLGAAVTAVQSLDFGVYVVMNGRIFDPRKARKNLEANRFEEIL